MAGAFNPQVFGHIIEIFDKHSVLHGNGSRRIALWQLRYVMQELGQNSEDIDAVDSIVQAANAHNKEPEVYIEFDEFIRLMRVIQEKVDAAKFYNTDTFDAWVTWGGDPSKIGFVNGRIMLENMAVAYHLDIDVDTLILKGKGERTYDDGEEEFKDMLDYKAFRDMWQHLMKEVHNVNIDKPVPSLQLDGSEERPATEEKQAKAAIRKAMAEYQRQKAKVPQRKALHPPTFSVPFPTKKVSPLETYLEATHADHTEQLHKLRTVIQAELSRHGLAPDGRNPNRVAELLDLRHAHHNGLLSNRTSSTHSTFGESVDDAWVLANPDHCPWANTDSREGGAIGEVDVYASEAQGPRRSKGQPKHRQNKSAPGGFIKLVSKKSETDNAESSRIGGSSGGGIAATCNARSSGLAGTSGEVSQRIVSHRDEQDSSNKGVPHGKKSEGSSNRPNNKQKVVASGVKKVSTRPVDFWTRRLEAQVRIEALRDQQRWHGQRLKASQMLAKFLELQRKQGQALKGSMYIDGQKDPELAKVLKATSQWIHAQHNQVPNSDTAKDPFGLPVGAKKGGGTQHQHQHQYNPLIGMSTVAATPTKSADGTYGPAAAGGMTTRSTVTNTTQVTDDTYRNRNRPTSSVTSYNHDDPLEIPSSVQEVTSRSQSSTARRESTTHTTTTSMSESSYFDEQEGSSDDSETLIQMLMDRGEKSRYHGVQPKTGKEISTAQLKRLQSMRSVHTAGAVFPKSSSKVSLPPRVETYGGPPSFTTTFTSSNQRRPTTTTTTTTTALSASNSNIHLNVKHNVKQQNKNVLAVGKRDKGMPEPQQQPKIKTKKKFNNRNAVLYRNRKSVLNRKKTLQNKTVTQILAGMIGGMYEDEKEISLEPPQFFDDMLEGIAKASELEELEDNIREIAEIVGIRDQDDLTISPRSGASSVLPYSHQSSFRSPNSSFRRTAPTTSTTAVLPGINMSNGPFPQSNSLQLDQLDELVSSEHESTTYLPPPSNIPMLFGNHHINSTTLHPSSSHSHPMTDTTHTTQSFLSQVSTTLPPNSSTAPTTLSSNISNFTQPTEHSRPGVVLPTLKL